MREGGAKGGASRALPESECNTPLTRRLYALQSWACVVLDEPAAGVAAAPLRIESRALQRAATAAAAAPDGWCRAVPSRALTLPPTPTPTPTPTLALPATTSLAAPAPAPARARAQARGRARARARARVRARALTRYSRARSSTPRRRLPSAARRSS